MPKPKDGIDGHKTCKKCQVCQPKENFVIFTGRGGVTGRKNTCDGCRIKKPGPYRCRGCNEMLPVDAFPMKLNSKRSTRCTDCRIKADEATKECAKCGQRWGFKNFPKSKKKRSTWCVMCHDNVEEKKKRFVRLDRPCLQCGGEMWCAKSRVKKENRKFCGRVCIIASMQVNSATCRECRLELPRSAFPAPRSGGWHETVRCSKCVKLIKEGRASTRAGATAITNIANMARWHSRKVGIENPVTRRHIMELIEQNCVMCGDVTQTATFLDYKTAFNIDTMRGACFYCHHMQNKRTLDETIAWALRVAAFAGQSLPAPVAAKVDPSSYAGRLALEFSGKTKEGKPAKHRNLVPPDSQMEHNFGETFEQKLARYAKARAERDEAGKDREHKHAADSYH